jgi:hypothetical protein
MMPTRLKAIFLNHGINKLRFLLDGSIPITSKSGRKSWPSLVSKCSPWLPARLGTTIKFSTRCLLSNRAHYSIACVRHSKKLCMLIAKSTG